MASHYTADDVIAYARLALDQHAEHLGRAVGKVRHAFPILTLGDALDLVLQAEETDRGR